jgi:hypothetical protein
VTTAPTQTNNKPALANQRPLVPVTGRPFGVDELAFVGVVVVCAGVGVGSDSDAMVMVVGRRAPEPAPFAATTKA